MRFECSNWLQIACVLYEINRKIEIKRMGAGVEAQKRRGAEFYGFSSKINDCINHNNIVCTCEFTIVHFRNNEREKRANINPLNKEQSKKKVCCVESLACVTHFGCC